MTPSRLEGGEPPEFIFAGTGRPGTKALRLGIRIQRAYDAGVAKDGIEQVPALVGSVIIRVKAPWRSSTGWLRLSLYRGEAVVGLSSP